MYLMQVYPLGLGSTILETWILKQIFKDNITKKSKIRNGPGIYRSTFAREILKETNFSGKSKKLLVISFQFS